MPPRSTRPPTVESLLPAILNLLTSDPPNPYSAHQKALTTTARLAQSGQSSLAIEILFSVSRELLKLGEAGSGVELGVRMLHLMGDSKVALDDKSRGMVSHHVNVSLLIELLSYDSFCHAVTCTHPAVWSMAQEARGLGYQMVRFPWTLPDRRPRTTPVHR